jgi:MFS transporter, DHA3 family, macrolide efflux protein
MRTFYTLWVGQTVSSLGSRVSVFALGLWIFTLTGRVTDLALVGVSFGLSKVLFNLIAGALVDRVSRKLLLWLTDSLDALVTICYLLLWLNGNLQPWHIYSGAVFRGMLDIVQSLAYEALVSTSVPKEHYVRASAMQGLTWYSGNLVGPGLGALFYYWLGLGGVFMIDLATFAIGIATVLGTKIPEPLRALSVAKGALESGDSLAQRLYRRLKQVLFDMGAGFRVAMSSKALASLFWLRVVFLGFDGAANALTTPMILARTSNNGAILAAVGIASGIGGIAASLLISFWGGPKRRRLDGMLLSMVGAGLGKLLSASSQSAPGWIVGQGFASANFPLMVGTMKAIWLTRIEQNLVGRVAAARGIMGEGAFYLCTALAAPLADNLFEPRFAASSGPGAGIALLYMLAAAGMALCGVVGWFLPGLQEVETPNK